MMKIRNSIASIVVLLTVATLASAQRRPAAAADPTERPRIDVESYSLDVTMIAKEHMLKGTAEVKFRQIERTSFVTFDLDNRLRVAKATMDGNEARFRQYDLDSTIEISTANGQLSEISTLVLEYEGFLDPPAGSKRGPVLASISEDGAYLLYEAKWFPTNGLYKDKAIASLTLRAPADWTALTDLPGSGGKFISTVPSFFGLVAAGKYTTTSIKTERGEVNIHTLKAKADDANPIVQSAAKTLDFYFNTFGPLAQNRFHIIEVPDANWTSRWGVGAMLQRTVPS